MKAITTAKSKTVETPFRYGTLEIWNDGNDITIFVYDEKGYHQETINMTYEQAEKLKEALNEAHTQRAGCPDLYDAYPEFNRER